MTTNPYTVSFLQIPKLIGRKKIINRLERHLTKLTPDHVSVIGPKFIGKTVILKNIEERFSRKDSYYTTVLYWDVRHKTPKTDQQFFAAFADKLRKSTENFDKELSELIEISETKAQGSIKDVFEILQQDSKKILVILDGLDELLSSESITRNLWDSLRELASLSSLRFVTGSRYRLRDLCASPESQTSDFWNIFDPTPVSIESFDEKDWEDFFVPFDENNITFDENAKLELKKWSGGVPILATLIASHLFEPNKPISKDFVDNVASKIKNDCQDHLNDLWYDCTAEEKGYLFDIAKNIEISCNNIPIDILRPLKNRGYVEEINNKIKSSCKLMKEHAFRQGENISLLRQIFNSSESCERNIQAFVELKLSQIKGGDSELKGYIGKAVRDMLPEPTQALVWTRNIVNCAFKLIWNKELPNRRIPTEWSDSWNRSSVSRPPQGNINDTDLAAQCRLLDLMTDTRISGQTRISRSSYLLINSLKSIGDFGQHLGTEKVTINFAVIACFTSIELCEKLEKELAN
ncbi:MAG: ATP-binding protein [Blastocatellia bacterium]